MGSVPDPKILNKLRNAKNNYKRTSLHNKCTDRLFNTPYVNTHMILVIYKVWSTIRGKLAFRDEQY